MHYMYRVEYLKHINLIICLKLYLLKVDTTVIELKINFISANCKMFSNIYRTPKNNTH